MGCGWGKIIVNNHVAVGSGTREKGTYASIQVHYKTCEKKVVTCPEEGCSEKMQRQHVDEHVKTDCQHAMISCKVYIHRL